MNNFFFGFLDIGSNDFLCELNVSSDFTYLGLFNLYLKHTIAPTHNVILENVLDRFPLKY